MVRDHIKATVWNRVSHYKMTSTLYDDRSLYTCFRAIACPSSELGEYVHCSVCRNNILLGVVFLHRYSEASHPKCTLIDEGLWYPLVADHKVIICCNCFYPKVELCYVVDSPEDYQISSISLATRGLYALCCTPMFKVRLKCNKTKSSRKLAE